MKLSRIVGIPDARLDQIVVACITLKDGADATPDDVRSFLKGRVAPYKVPKHVRFRDEPLPRGMSGKVLKRELRDEYAPQAEVAPRSASH